MVCQVILHSYLVIFCQERNQYVEFNSKQSDFRILSTEVPQGSILGPLLFIIYINDINMVTTLFKPIIYADDTILSATLNTFGNVIQNLEQPLPRLCG